MCYIINMLELSHCLGLTTNYSVLRITSALKELKEFIFNIAKIKSEYKKI